MKTKKTTSLGKCPGCEKNVFINEKFEEIYYDSPTLWNPYYLKGLVHKKCLVKVYKNFTNQLLRDNYFLSDMLLEVLKSKKVAKIGKGRKRSSRNKRTNN